MRRLAIMLAVILAAMAEAVRTTVRLVWRAGRWIAESVAAPRSRAPAAAVAADEALDALAEASLPAPAPAVTAPEPAPVCPASEWGAVALAYAVARKAGEPEPDLRTLDEAALAWLRGLDDADLGRLRMLTPRQAGEHMLGTWPIPGLSLCPTIRQHQASLLPTPPAPRVAEPEPAALAYAGPRLAYG
ncbi:hypothetical protein BHAOGJBA_0687 [Methylobacterium hispanicum]|uniref:Uncharacterized protein n=1 Tax=Methylobacterium hispanicum TaxID=270350 RepID=A0AAV4ZFP6_9HYPH|nr:hypothetical protein [Methylobacterium hispanicum]GJD87187.1 hypothetical protein BHAOGJBA_0687 [Methylobacterium hispanicum]